VGVGPDRMMYRAHLKARLALRPPSFVGHCFLSGLRQTPLSIVRADKKVKFGHWGGPLLCGPGSHDDAQGLVKSALDAAASVSVWHGAPHASGVNSRWARQPRRSLGVKRLSHQNKLSAWCVGGTVMINNTGIISYKPVTVSLPKRFRNGRFDSETAVQRS
jgi:hypothetical protein